MTKQKVHVTLKKFVTNNKKDMGAVQSGGAISDTVKTMFSDEDIVVEDPETYSGERSTVFLDVSDKLILKQLSLKCTDNGEDCKEKIKNIVVYGHGNVVDPSLDFPGTPSVSFEIPRNIVVLFMGELGKWTGSTQQTHVVKKTFDKEYDPYSVSVRGTTIPNVLLSGEDNYNERYPTGIYQDSENPLTGFGNWLRPIDDDVKSSMDSEMISKISNKKTDKQEQKDKHAVYLEDILREISFGLPEDTYGFVHVFSCLPVCNWGPKDDVEKFIKPDGFKALKAYNTKRLPNRVETYRIDLEINDNTVRYDPILSDNELTKLRNAIVRSVFQEDDLYNSMIFVQEFITKYKDAFWYDHFIHLNELINVTKSPSLLFYINHTKMILAIDAENEDEIERLWNRNITEKYFLLLPLQDYINYSEGSVKTMLSGLDKKSYSNDMLNNELTRINDTITEYFGPLKGKRNLTKGKKYILELTKNNVPASYEKIKAYLAEIMKTASASVKKQLQTSLNTLTMHQYCNAMINDSTMDPRALLLASYWWTDAEKNSYKKALNMKNYISFVHDNENVRRNITGLQKYLDDSIALYFPCDKNELQLVNLIENGSLDDAKRLLLSFTKKNSYVDYQSLNRNFNRRSKQAQPDIPLANYYSNVADILLMHNVYNAILHDIVDDETNNDIIAINELTGETRVNFIELLNKQDYMALTDDDTIFNIVLP